VGWGGIITFMSSLNPLQGYPHSLNHIQLKVHKQVKHIYIYIYICIHGKMALQVQHGPGAPTCKHAYIDILLRFNRLNATIKWCGTCPPKRCHRSAPLTRFNRGCRKVPHSDECAIAHHHPNTNKL